MNHPIRLACSACGAVHRLAHLAPGKTYHCKKCDASLRTAEPAWAVCPACGYATGPENVDLGRLHACPHCTDGSLLEARFSPPPAPALPDPLLNTPGEALTQAVDEAVDRVLERAFGGERIEALARRIEKPLEEELTRQWESAVTEALAPKIEAALQEKLAEAVRGSGLPDLADDLKLQVEETLKRIRPQSLPAPPPALSDEASREAVVRLVGQEMQRVLSGLDLDARLVPPLRDAVARLLEERLPAETPSPLDREETRAAMRKLVAESVEEAVRRAGWGDIGSEMRSAVRETLAEALPEPKPAPLDPAAAESLAATLGARLGGELRDSLAAAVNERMAEQTDKTILPRLVETVPAQSAMALRDLLRTELGQAVGEAVEEAGLGEMAARIQQAVSTHVRQTLDGQLKEQLETTLRQQTGAMVETAVDRVHGPLVAEIQQTRSSIPLWLAGLLVLPVLAIMGVLLAWALSAGSEVEIELAKKQHTIDSLLRSLDDMREELARSRKELDSVERAAWDMNQRAKNMELQLRALGHDPDILASDAPAGNAKAGP